jgi:hypothetical protein
MLPLKEHEAGGSLHNVLVQAGLGLLVSSHQPMIGATAHSAWAAGQLVIIGITATKTTDDPALR